MLRIRPGLAIEDREIEVSAIRAQGAGGQNVNKVSSAIHLRFDIQASSLPDEVKQKLLSAGDRRISSQGVLVIKAQQFRTREANLEDALGRLREIVFRASQRQRRRIATRPTRASQKRRLEQKSQRGKTKSMRGRVMRHDDYSPSAGGASRAFFRGKKKRHVFTWRFYM